jgi:hypothetical protein
LKNLIAGEGPDAGREYEKYVEEGLKRPDEEFLEAMMRSPRSIGDDKFREWVEEEHQVLMKTHGREEDISFRMVGKRVLPEQVLKAVTAQWKMSLPELARRRRGCLAKAVAAWMLEKHAGLTRRAIGPWLGIGSGTGVGYQIRQAMDGMKTESGLARRVERIERVFKKEANE